jgi:hypothetical protein
MQHALSILNERSGDLCRVFNFDILIEHFRVKDQGILVRYFGKGVLVK